MMYFLYFLTRNITTNNVFSFSMNQLDFCLPLVSVCAWTATGSVKLDLPDQSGQT